MTAVEAGHVDLQEARRSRLALVPRIGGSALTPDFESVWPDVAARLRPMLRRRGVKHHDIDEIVQETAARVISTRVPYENGDDLFRWAAVVAGRLAIDLRRRGARLSDEELPDRADSVDVATAAEHRVALQVVRDRLPELSERDREALLSSFADGVAPSRRESVRLAVARHRARNRLRLLLDGLAGTAIVAWVRRNRLWSAPVEAISYAAVPTAACLLITLGAWTGLVETAAPEVGSPSERTSRVTPVPSAGIAPTDPIVNDTSTRNPAPPPPTRPRVAPEMPDPYVTITTPDGDRTRVGLRDKEESDHLWCLTISPSGKPETTCVDSPVPLPATPDTP